MKKCVLTIMSWVLALVLTFMPTIVSASEATSQLFYLGNGNAVAPFTYREYYDDYIIQTPVGQNVTVGVFRYDDLSSEQKDEAHNDMVEEYVNILLISDASFYYNCHSYAWYSQQYATNQFWMYDPSEYFNNTLDSENSHQETNGMVGDIIVYFNSSNEPIHSGIVVKTMNGTSNGACDDADLIIVQSKWGDYGLYTHRGDICPYSSSYTNVAGQYATYVKYYRLKNHEHEWDVEINNSDWDTISCTVCSLTMYHELSYVDIQNNMFHSLNCSFCGTIDTYAHECNSYTNSEEDNCHIGVCSLCNAEIHRSHVCTTYVKSEATGYHKGTCTICGGTVYERHEWEQFANKYRCTVCNYVTRNISALGFEEKKTCIE